MSNSRSSARVRARPALTGAKACAVAAVVMAAVIVTARAAWPLVPVGAAFILSSITLFVVVGLVAAYLVSERERTLRALQASEAQFRAIWDHAATGTALLSPQGTVERVNPALERVLGFASADWSGMPFDRFIHADDLADMRAQFETIMRGEGLHYQCEQRHLRQDGTLVWCHVTVSAILPAAGAPTSALMTVEDITARRQADADLHASEEKLRQAQKMEAVGQLVAGVAHNFNNLLTITMGYTEILLERHRGADEDQAELEQIRLATAKAASLTRHLLTFSRQRETAPAPIDLNRALADLRPILTRAVREDIQLTIQTAAAQATVLIDLQDFDQVILNLVINARDALPSGGAIEITLEPRSLSAAECPSDVVPGDYICIEVRDDGVGMTDEVQAHLFEPFFTTKEVGQGTGLGLASTYGTVRQHRGFVRVSSAPERGTAVSLWFPCAGPGAASETVPVSTPMRTRRKSPHATILVVEDEGGVRAVTAGTLSRAGHRVFEAASASEACAIFARHANEIDLLVTDVVMPEMRGPVLARRLLATRPGLPVLLVSGYNDVEGETHDPEQMMFLAKPFTPSRLVAAVTELLVDN